MHFPLAIWIFLFLSTTVAGPDHGPTNHGSTKAQIKTLSETRVITTLSGDKEHLAIFLGYTQDESMRIKLVHFGIRVRQYHAAPSRYEVFFSSYFKNVWMARGKDETGAAEGLTYSRLDQAGTPMRKLGGKIDLRVQYMMPESIHIPDDNLILNKVNANGVDRLKAAISVLLVNEAFAYDSLVVDTSGRAKSFETLEEGRVVWVSSEFMYGGYKKPDHLFHFGIFLGFADPHGSASRKLKIAQIVMNLPFPTEFQPKGLADFEKFFPTTWWWEDKILLDGDIDLTLHKIYQNYIRIPNTRLILDSTGVKKLEHRMATFRLTGYPPPKHRFYSLPANYHERPDDSGSEDGGTSETQLTRHNSASEVAGHF
ncbi:hypothetical protein APHAL10511_007657 [Amanita phalloides]|nr:hypothetical protein APHAL10511_007657 [Amanita phalloides]